MNSAPVARKSHKLASLPDDLRSEADKLIAQRFPAPEPEIKKKSDPVYDVGRWGDKVDVDLHRDGGKEYLFPYWDNSSINFAATDEIIEVSHRAPAAIDDYTIHQLESINHMPPTVSVEVDVEFQPVGTFYNRWKSDERQFMQEIRMQTLRVQGWGGQGQSIQSRMEAQRAALRMHYGGDFVFRIRNVTWQTDMYAHYYRENNM